MRKNVDFKGWNSQAVQKAEASMVNTIRVRINTARESVNPCSNKRLESYTTRRHALLVRNGKHHGDNKREVNIIPIDNFHAVNRSPYKSYMQILNLKTA